MVFFCVILRFCSVLLSITENKNPEPTRETYEGKLVNDWPEYVYIALKSDSKFFTPRLRSRSQKDIGDLQEIGS